MRLAVLSDIHGNMNALRSVLVETEAASCDFVLCLGDVVGYGPEPREVVETLRRLRARCVLGNHDAAAVCREDAGTFNASAAMAVSWTQEQLDRRSLDYLAGLRPTRRTAGCFMAHALPSDPLSWRYLSTPAAAGLELEAMSERVCLVGHTHVPMIVERIGARVRVVPDTIVRLRNGARYLINVGSVGQPRDEDPRACYAIYDRSERTIVIRRVEYDAEATRAKIIEAGLPPFLGDRLLKGV